MPGRFVLALVAVLACGRDPKPTPIGGACRQDEEKCAAGSGQCVFWAGKQTCMATCGYADSCPTGYHATTIYGYECFCEPGASLPVDITH